MARLERLGECTLSIYNIIYIILIIYIYNIIYQAVKDEVARLERLGEELLETGGPEAEGLQEVYDRCAVL